MNTAPLDWRSLADDLLPHGVTVEYAAETGSTNDDARAAAQQGAPHGFTVLADAQHSGRGRRGAAWHSPRQRNLIASTVLRPAMPLEHWSRLTHACALSVCEALDDFQDMPAAQIKWPNDIYVSGLKVCGILVESTLHARGSFAIAGAGVNLNLRLEDLPPELRTTATSVWLQRGGLAVERENFARRYLLRLMENAERAAYDFPALLAECERRSFLTGKRIRLTAGEREVEGRAAGLGPEGELLIETAAGVEVITSADFVRVVPG
jgi:BirA family transcriptional regulator, biotin operon repressor / biotin---[acetyl-CoA-carboxylase] ligase